MYSEMRLVKSEPNAEEPELGTPSEKRNDDGDDGTSGSIGSSTLRDCSVDGIRSRAAQQHRLRDVDDNNLRTKKQRIMSQDVGFPLDLPPSGTVGKDLAVLDVAPLSIVPPSDVPDFSSLKPANVTKQFWKAGDYEGDNSGDTSASRSAGIDHVRVHPKFLHSNATSHKWALGALAELLDNSLDEFCNGATYVHVDMTKNMKDGNYMLIVEDNGGGMDPDNIRQCMSLGYSVKSKMVNTIGQYGNGFKTSTMRLGADAIVFTRFPGTGEKRPTQSIGMLSYTFLRATRMEDIVVPMIHFEKNGEGWDRMIRSTADDWNKNLETIIQWSPYLSEMDLIQQFNFLPNQGTRIIIYNLWEDDEGRLELDFDMDPYDIQLRGVNRDERHLEMAKKYPNCKHFFTYRHSLRSYASILYLRLPQNFKIILRGKEVEHRNLVNDIMLRQEIKYKPLHLAEGTANGDSVVTVTLGFVKDAYKHIDVQGFNVYHKNRLIKPFWRVWNPAGSDGRGVIGVLEANFIEPAHDKQGFERTTALSRLEARLVKLQRRYWSSTCHEVGYAPRTKKPDLPGKESGESSKAKLVSGSDEDRRSSKLGASKVEEVTQNGKRPLIDSPVEDEINDRASPAAERRSTSCGRINSSFRCPNLKGSTNIVDDKIRADSDPEILVELKRENRDPRKRLKESEVSDLLEELQNERERRQSLEAKLNQERAELKELDKEHITLLDMLQEERARHQEAEEALKEKLREASQTIDGLLDRVRELEASIPPSYNRILRR